MQGIDALTPCLVDAPNVRVVDASGIGRETRFGTFAVSPAIEPLSLRLPRDLLVLQPLQGHLDVEPVLLAPGLRCVIGSAEGCTLRLTKSTLVRPEHCTIEITGRQTVLTHWVPETTWLNDRLVRDPSELVPGDRIAIGPFDFQVRSASADELLYAKLVEHDPSDTNKVDDVLRRKRTIDESKRDTNTAPFGGGHELALDLFSELLRESSEGSDSGTFEQLPQHITRLLSELQSQVCELQEREAELSEQLRSQYEPINPTRRDVVIRTETADSAEASSQTSVVVAPDVVPAAVRPEYEQVLELLKSERDELDRVREQVDQEWQNLAAEQEQWQEQKQRWTEQIEDVQAKFAELESQQQSVVEEREVSRSLAHELMRDQARLTEWKDRLRLEERELARRRDEMNRPDLEEESNRSDDLSPSEAMMTEPASATLAAPAPLVPAPWIGPTHVPATFTSPSRPGQPKQTLMTLVAFGLAALLFSGSFGDHEANTTIGWGTALIGAISTVDLLLRRCFSSNR